MRISPEIRRISGLILYALTWVQRYLAVHEGAVGQRLLKADTKIAPTVVRAINSISSRPKRTVMGYSADPHHDCTSVLNMRYNSAQIY